jgi:hemerythrin-like domain-containing protein
MSMNRAIHGAFRRDLGRFDAALGAFQDGDAKRAAGLKAAWDHFNSELTRHHTDEHRIAWPALRSVGVSDEVLATMDAEHDRLAAALKAADTAMGMFATAPTRANAAAAKQAIGSLSEVAEEHMTHEEAEIDPVYVAKADAPEIKEMGRKFARGNPVVAGNFMAWVTNGASAEEMAGLRANVPGPVLTIFSKVIGMSYNRRIAPVWKN